LFASAQVLAVHCSSRNEEKNELWSFLAWLLFMWQKAKNKITLNGSWVLNLAKNKTSLNVQQIREKHTKVSHNF